MQFDQRVVRRLFAPLLKPTFRIGRDNVSKWVRAKVLPLPPALEAVCKVLEMETRELLPERATPIPEPDDHSACEEALRKAHRERDEARREAAICREEARKERAFYHGQIARQQEQIEHLTALIPMWSRKHPTRRSGMDGPELANPVS
jgi:hypothetical protein